MIILLKKKLWKKYSYCFYLIFSTFLLLEIFTSIFLPQPYRTISTKLHDDGLLTNKKSNKSFHSYFNVEPVQYSYGSLYSRINTKLSNLDFNYKNNYHCNILVLGDSFAFGWLIPDDKHFVDILQNKLLEDNEKKIILHNSSVGGSALSYYVAFTKKFKDEISNFNGVLVFLNSADISDSRLQRNVNYYSFADSFNSRTLMIKKFIDKKYVSHIYSFLIKNINLFRISKNLLQYKKIFIANNLDHRQLKTNNSYEMTEEYKSPNIINTKKSLNHLVENFSNNLSQIPSNFIFIGDSNPKNFHSSEKLFFGEWGKELLKSNNIRSDFSLTNISPVFDLKNEIIQGDGHPNMIGHEKIAGAIYNSNSKNNLKKFVKNVCKVNS